MVSLYQIWNLIWDCNTNGYLPYNYLTIITPLLVLFKIKSYSKPKFLKYSVFLLRLYVLNVAFIFWGIIGGVLNPRLYQSTATYDRSTDCEILIYNLLCALTYIMPWTIILIILLGINFLITLYTAPKNRSNN